MFYCGFDPGLEAYLVSQGLESDTSRAEPAQIWAASALLAITIASLITVALL